ncbi:hypothetical protein PNP85_10365 [Halobacterium salinarum]|uniref:Uncharacterized protein n=5 Tax=Halobacterium salinarum TaxID=2242 RepID=Q9HPV1_HALSA|nr:hypothetical protein [Halobacterium salinarum]AAG19766.1 hypothetical protein VNG_1461H [Halobacterium salinarum NRC-1]QRY21827.1 hypothetical protein JT689_07260 [Halobacterium sp. GSL-19]CAP14050.1 uncharacterized protein OE_3097R [Halobacterium salinarum R1]MCF2165278.1 hypothetical protein [Halobacterium salinarum]MCF2167913.1 hypothetical protein [Halobacterium salinarum]
MVWHIVEDAAGRSGGMEKQDLVVAVHVMVAVAIAAFGLVRISRGQRVPGALNVGFAIVVVGVGVYMRQLV